MDADCALVYYTDAAKINSEGHNVPHCTHLAILDEILCLSFVLGLTMEEIMRTYEDQLWDPANWMVRSFHDNAGTVLNDATMADSTILGTAGHPKVQTAIQTCPKNLMFAFVRVGFDFSHMTNCMVTLFLETFIQLPQHTVTIPNGTGGDYILTNFHGRNDITSYSKDKFRTLKPG